MAFDELSVDTSEESFSAGLGLCICRKLIRKMGGRLRVDSQLNEGTQFTVTLETQCMMGQEDVHRFERESR